MPVQEELPPKPAEPQPAPQPEVTRRSAIAMYDYEAANPGDMSFKAGEVMELSEVSTCCSPGGFIVTVDRPCVHLQIPDSLGGPSEGWIYALSLTTHNEGVVPEGYLEMRAT